MFHFGVMEVVELKKKYESFSKKYSLPAFDKVNQDFEIGKIDHDTGLILKTVRKVMMEKVVNSLGLVEMLLNPVNAPRMYMPFIRSITTDDKKNIDALYASLTVLSMKTIEREMIYDEKAEAELIKDIVKRWDENRPRFIALFDKMKNPPKVNSKKERSYFG